MTEMTTEKYECLCESLECPHGDAQCQNAKDLADTKELGLVCGACRFNYADAGYPLHAPDDDVTGAAVRHADGSEASHRTAVIQGEGWLCEVCDPDYESMVACAREAGRAVKVFDARDEEDESDGTEVTAVDLMVKIAEDGWEHDGEVDVVDGADAGYFVKRDETALVMLRDGSQYLVTVQEVTR